MNQQVRITHDALQTKAPAKKSLGQHFLRCPWVLTTMLDCAMLTSDDTVVEIGPGTGALTRAIARRAGRVIAIEKDEQLAAILHQDLANEHIANVEVIPGDILQILKEPRQQQLPATNYKLIGNLPYYITGRLFRALPTLIPKPSLVVLMVQKEVAERIAATPPDTNLLCLAVQIWGIPTIIKTVPPECFSPTPRVTSAILTIVPHERSPLEQASIDEEHFFTIVKKAFQQKRKMLRSSLGKILPLPDSIQKKRPQELSLNEWITLAKLQ